MRVYLDNCCFNRPYDDQSQFKIRLESEAKLAIQDRIIRGELDLIWSFILDFENDANPYDERRMNIEKWQSIAMETILKSDLQLKYAEDYVRLGLQSKDALHLSAATVAGCNYFIKTDDGILKKSRTIELCKVINPVDFFTRELL